MLSIERGIRHENIEEVYLSGFLFDLGGIAFGLFEYLHHWPLHSNDFDGYLNAYRHPYLHLLRFMHADLHLDRNLYRDINQYFHGHRDSHENFYPH